MMRTVDAKRAKKDRSRRAVEQFQSARGLVANKAELM
jgi:hypothetical protein